MHRVEHSKLYARRINMWSSSVSPTASRACIAASVLLLLLAFAPYRTCAAAVDPNVTITEKTSTEVTPVNSEVISVSTEVIPASTEVIPASTEVIPASTEVMPNSTEVTPAVAEVTTRAAPEAIMVITERTEAVPEATTVVTGETTPAVAKGISIAPIDPGTTTTSNVPDFVDTTGNSLEADISSPPANLRPPLPPAPKKNGDIYSFIIHSKIKYRYAQTVVSSRVANKGNSSHEVQFFVTLPESAFVSKFLMEINEKVYEAYVKEKKEAKEEYIVAVNLGQTAAHVEQNARDSNKFTVSVNVEAESKVTFNLTYEQLLTRKLGIYENVINLQPGQVVKNLQVIVDIEESSNITTLKVPDIKTVNEIETSTSTNKLAKIYRESGNKATITWNPTVKEQLTFTERGVKGQFIIQYDVDHKSTPNQVLVDDGYFVHFFAPTDLKPLRTHVIFVLDVSGSMVGQKLPQVKDAMSQILSEIHSDDFFTLILFSDYAQVWTINATQETSTRWDETGIPMSSDNFSLETLGENRFVFPATEKNIELAKHFIKDLTSESSTNMEDALNKAHAIAKLGETRFKNSSNTPKPIIVFLTDGEPTTGITEPQDLIRYVSNINEEKYPIYSLGFGEGADIDFLKKLSLNNSGFARVIYEASDASIQLRNFYKEISSPVLSNVSFKYIDTQVDNITVTKKSFNLYFSGTELVVAGKLKDAKSDFNSSLHANSTEGNFNDPIIVTCFDYPISPPVPDPQTKRIGHLEKLWAYLYIQQLMDQYELNKNENSTEKDKALELALKYSFVTPLTSLIVVKPNDTTTSAVPEKIKPPINDRYNLVGASPGASMASAVGYFQKLGPPSALNMYPTPVRYSSSMSTKSGNVYASHMLPMPSSPFVVAEDSEISASEMIDSSSTSVLDSLLLPEINSTLLHDISEIKWLSVFNDTQPSISLNLTNYQILLNTTAQAYQNCTTPDNVYGSCKHLKDCIVTSILDSFDVYTSLFCSITNIYAGICCTV